MRSFVLELHGGWFELAARSARLVCAWSDTGKRSTRKRTKAASVTSHKPTYRPSGSDTEMLGLKPKACQKRNLPHWLKGIHLTDGGRVKLCIHSCILDDVKSVVGG
jgi:hypothetical protein